MLVHSWLQVPYTEHSSKSAGQRVISSTISSGKWVPSHTTLGWCASLQPLWRTIGQNPSQQERCKLYHLASPNLESTLEKYPHTCTLSIHSERIS